MKHIQPSNIAKPANISPSAAAEDQSAIASEREQLLPHIGGTEEFRRRKSADHDGNSTQSQLCGRNAVIPNSKPRCEIACYLAYPILTIGTAGRVKASPPAPDLPKPTLRTFKSGPGSRSSHVEGPLCPYRSLSRLQYSYSISR